MVEPPIDFRVVVKPPCLLIVASSNFLKDTPDVGIVRAPLPRPVSIRLGKVTFLSAPFANEAPGHTSPVTDADIEPRSDFVGPEPFHRFGNGQARPDTAVIGWSPGQDLADVLVTHRRTAVLRAEPARLGDPP